MMKSREISFGRATDSTQVDLDFSTFGLATRVSRNHGQIKMTDNCTFYLYNNSSRPVFVDGKIVLKSCKTQLFDKTIIQVLSALLKSNFPNRFKRFCFIGGRLFAFILHKLQHNDCATEKPPDKHQKLEKLVQVFSKAY
jgi:hypothetical protein